MTEADWNACTDPQPMLEFLRGRASDRKLRLFVCACCRGGFQRLKYKPLQRAIEVAERYADGQATTKELDGIAQVVGKIWYALEDDGYDTHWSVLVAAERYFQASPNLNDHSPLNAACQVRAIEPRQRADILRDMIGNPLRPVILDPAWNTAPVTTLAEPSTLTAFTTACRSWPTPWRTPVAPTRTSWRTAAALARMFAAAGWSIC